MTAFMRGAGRMGVEGSCCPGFGLRGTCWMDFSETAFQVANQYKGAFFSI